MSDLSPAAQELNEDLRLLFDGRTIGNGPASERVFGADEGVPRTVGESRDRYRKPIVEAFAASGAKTLVEFPERVRDLCERAALRDETRTDAARLLHERDRYKALAEQQSATVEAAAGTIRQAHTDMANLKAELDGTQQQLRAVIGIKEKQAGELTLAHEKVTDLGKKLTLARDELGALYATERRLRESVKWAMKCIEDLLLKGDT